MSLTSVQHLTGRELWREDGKLAQSASNAKSELDNAERSLQGMMDKVKFTNAGANR